MTESGFDVRILGTTGLETAGDAGEVLAELGLVHDKEKAPHERRPEWHYRDGGAFVRLLDVAGRNFAEWQDVLGSQYDRMFDDELISFKPDVLFTFGGHRADVARRARAARQGVRVVFGLRNASYATAMREVFENCHAILTPSRFLAGFYRERLGLDATALPPPMEPAEVISAEHDPIFITMVNPRPQKGVMVMARIAEEIGVRRPDLAALVVESRGRAGELVEAGLRGGFDLRRHENLMSSPAVAQPREIYANSRCVLVPSLANEAFGRVVAEALMNGVIPIVTDRGGLPEACAGAGFVLEAPVSWTPDMAQPASAAEVEPWMEIVERLEDDPAFYAAQRALALQAARAYSKPSLLPRYAEFFQTV